MSKKKVLGIAVLGVLGLATLVPFSAKRNGSEVVATVPEPGREMSTSSIPAAPANEPKTGAGTSAPAQSVGEKKPEDVYAGVSAEKVTAFKRAESLLEPRDANDGVWTAAARDGAALLAEKAARATAVMRLGQYRLNLSPEAGARLLRLTSRVLRYRPSGSYSRHRNDRAGALSEEWGALLSEAEYLLRRKIRTGEPFDAAVGKKIQSLRKTEYRLRPEVQGADAFPDLETAILRGTLTGDELLPFLFHLDDCMRQIAWHRTLDGEAADLLKLFSDEERFLILNRLDGRGQGATRTVGRRYVPVDRADMDAKYDFSAKANKAVGGIIAELKTSFFTDTKFWKDFSAEYLTTILEIESARQTRLKNLFAGADADALESLRVARALHDELAACFDSAIPDSGYRLRRWAAPGEDGKARERPIAPVEFKPVDPKRYVLEIEDVHQFFNNAGKTFYISFRHTLDDSQPFALLEQIRADEPADRIKFDVVSEAGTTWTYKDANGAKYVTRIEKSRSDAPIKGAETCAYLTTGPRGTKDQTAETIIAANGVYTSKISGLTVSPPMLVFPLSASKTEWSVDSKIGDSDRITVKTTSQRKRMTVLGAERDVIVTTSAGTVSGKAYTRESVYCSGLGTVRESWGVDGKAESRELVNVDRK